MVVIIICMTAILQLLLRNYMFEKSQLGYSRQQTVLCIRRCVNSSLCLTLCCGTLGTEPPYLTGPLFFSLCKMPSSLCILCLEKKKQQQLAWDHFRAPLVVETSAMASIISLFWNSTSPNISYWRLFLGAFHSSTLLIHMIPASLYVMKYIWKQPRLRE